MSVQGFENVVSGVSSLGQNRASNLGTTGREGANVCSDWRSNWHVHTFSVAAMSLHALPWLPGLESQENALVKLLEWNWPICCYRILQIPVPLHDIMMSQCDIMVSQDVPRAPKKNQYAFGCGYLHSVETLPLLNISPWPCADPVFLIKTLLSSVLLASICFNHAVIVFLLVLTIH